MKNTIIAIFLALVLIVLAFFIKGRGNDETQKPKQIPINNVSIVDGTQIIEIQAKGGYTPIKNMAKANVPTILRFNTKGTFDCSSSVRIPSINISQVLPQSGVTDIDLGTQKIGTLEGSCGMGMYPFEIEFQ